MRSKQGFSLLEVLAALCILALATGGLLLGYSGLQHTAQMNNAIAKASLINTAKSLCVFTNFHKAAAYEGATNDSERFNVVKEYIPYVGPSVTLEEFTPKGFLIHMNGLMEKVTLTQNNNEIEY